LTPPESEAIHQLTESVNLLRLDLSVMHTELFGKRDAENDQGRLPRMEMELKRQGLKIAKHDTAIKRPLWMAAGMSALCGLIVASAMFLYYIQSILKGH